MLCEFPPMYSTSPLSSFNASPSLTSSFCHLSTDSNSILSMNSYSRTLEWVNHHSQSETSTSDWASAVTSSGSDSPTLANTTSEISDLITLSDSITNQYLTDIERLPNPSFGSNVAFEPQIPLVSSTAPCSFMQQTENFLQPLSSEEVSQVLPDDDCVTSPGGYQHLLPATITSVLSDFSYCDASDQYGQEEVCPRSTPHTSTQSTPVSSTTTTAYGPASPCRSSESTKGESKRRQLPRGSPEYNEKRSRNNVAVRKSRAKAKLRQREMSEQIRYLTEQNDFLAKKVEFLTNQLITSKGYLR